MQLPDVLDWVDRAQELFPGHDVQVDAGGLADLFHYDAV
jgi:hypothetical protein